LPWLTHIGITVSACNVSRRQNRASTMHSSDRKISRPKLIGALPKCFVAGREVYPEEV
jgi:hypothetical protein